MDMEQHGDVKGKALSHLEWDSAGQQNAHQDKGDPFYFLVN